MVYSFKLRKKFTKKGKLYWSDINNCLVTKETDHFTDWSPQALCTLLTCGGHILRWSISECKAGLASVHVAQFNIIVFGKRRYFVNLRFLWSAVGGIVRQPGQPERAPSSACSRGQKVAAEIPRSPAQQTSPAKNHLNNQGQNKTTNQHIRIRLSSLAKCQYGVIRQIVASQ